MDGKLPRHVEHPQIRRERRPALHVLSAQEGLEHVRAAGVLAEELFPDFSIDDERLVATRLDAVERLRLRELRQRRPVVLDLPVEGLGHLGLQAPSVRREAPLRYGVLVARDVLGDIDLLQRRAREGRHRELMVLRDRLALREPAEHDDTGEGVRALEDGGVPEVDQALNRGAPGEEPAQGGRIAGAEPLVGDDEAEAPVRLEDGEPTFEEVHVDVRHAVIGHVRRAEVVLAGREDLVANVGRVAEHHVEALRPAGLDGLCVRLRRGARRLPERPVEGHAGQVGVVDDAVAPFDVAVEVRPPLAVLRGLEPERELGDLDRLGVEIHAEQVVVEHGRGEIEQLDLAAVQVGQLGVDTLVLAPERTICRHEEGARAAGRIEHAEAPQLRAIGDPGVDGCRGLRLLSSPLLGLETIEDGLAPLGERAAQGAVHDVPGEVGRRVVNPLVVSLRGPARRGAAAERFEIALRPLEDVPQHLDRDVVAKVVPAEVCQRFAQLVRDLQVVELLGKPEETAAVRGELPIGVAAVDPAEDCLEVVPERPGIVLVAVSDGAGERVPGEQIAVLREGGEEEPIEDRLRVAEHLQRGQVGVRLPELGEEPLAQAAVLGVEGVRDLFLGPGRRREQQLHRRGDAGRGAEEALAGEEIIEALEALDRREILQQEGLADVGRARGAVEARLPVVGDEDEFAARRVAGVVPRLLHGRQGATAGPVEVLPEGRELDGHEDAFGLTPAEEPQRAVDRLAAGPHALLGDELPAFGPAVRDGAVSEGVAEDAAQEHLLRVVEAASLQRLDEAEEDGVAAVEVAREDERRDLLGMNAGVEERARAEQRGHARR